MRFPDTDIFAPLLSRYGVHAYMSGHDHTMQHHVVDNVDYFVAGTGSKIGAIREPIYGSIFALARQGFIAGSVGSSVMKMQFLDYAGDYLYEVNIPRSRRGGSGR